MTMLLSSPLSPNDLTRGIIRFGEDVRAHLPPGAVGGSSLDAFAPDPVTFHWRGESSRIDMPVDKNGKGLRWFFRARERGFLARFLRESGAMRDDVVVLEQIGPRDYRLHVERPGAEKERIKKWVLREARPDQQEFRRNIAERDGLKCAISGCAIPEVLDAAHLDPHGTGGSSDPSNGIILRSDIHRLFDSSLLSIDQHGQVSITPMVKDADYLSYDGISVATGADLKHLEGRAR